MARKGRINHAKSGIKRKEIPDGACKICSEILCSNNSKDGTRVQCEHCDGWFHLYCEQITEEDPARIDNFYCRGCTQLHPEKVVTYVPRRKRQRTETPASSTPRSDSKASWTSGGTLSSMDSPMTPASDHASTISTSDQASETSPTSAPESSQASSTTTLTVSELILAPSSTSKRSLHVSKPPIANPSADPSRSSLAAPSPTTIRQQGTRKKKVPKKETEIERKLENSVAPSEQDFISVQEPRSPPSENAVSTCIVSGFPSPSSETEQTVESSPVAVASSETPTILESKYGASETLSKDISATESVKEDNLEIPVGSVGDNEKSPEEIVQDEEKAVEGMAGTLVTEHKHVETAEQAEVADECSDVAVENPQWVSIVNVSRISIGLAEETIPAEESPQKVAIKTEPITPLRQAPVVTKKSIVEQMGDVSSDEDDDDDEEENEKSFAADSRDNNAVASPVPLEPVSDDRDGASSVASSGSSSSCALSVSAVVSLVEDPVELPPASLHDITDKQNLAAALKTDPDVLRQVDEIIANHGGKLSREDIFVWFDKDGELDNVIKFRKLTANQEPKK